MTLLPPPQYDVPPPMPVIERVMTREEVDKECAALAAVRNEVRPANRRFLGCATIAGDPREGDHFGKDVCLVWRIADDAVRHHELAHCNGWQHPSELTRKTAAAPTTIAVSKAQPSPVMKSEPPAKTVPVLRSAVPVLPPMPALQSGTRATDHEPHITVLNVRPAPDLVTALPTPMPRVPLSSPSAVPQPVPWPIRDADVDRAPRAQQQPEGRSALDAIGDALISGMTRR